MLGRRADELCYLVSKMGRAGELLQMWYLGQNDLGQRGSDMIKNWLFIRGMVREQRHWEEFPSIFEEKFPAARVYFLDLPGIGTMGHMKSPLDIPSIIEICQRRFDQIKEGVSGDWGILGVSLGGMVSLSWMDVVPKQFKLGVVINSSAASLSHPLERMQPQTLMRFLKTVFLKDRKKIERVILERTVSAHTDTSEILKRWAQIAPDPKMVRNLAFRQMLAAGRFVPTGNLSVPLLFIGAKGDRLAHWKCSLKLSQRYGGSFALHPWGGHDLTLEDPKWCINKISEWTKKLGISGDSSMSEIKIQSETSQFGKSA